MSSTRLIPLWLDWSGRTVLVIGLGTVGQRRALMFQQSGATVVGIDPLPKIQGPAWGELIRNGLELRSEPYHESVFDELAQYQMGPDLVMACASEVVNANIVRDALARRLWVVSGTASAEQPSNAHLGALASGELVQIAVHSGNVAPALSRAVGARIQADFLPAADRIAQEAARWRGLILARVSDPEKRQSLLSLFGSDDLLKQESEQPGSGVDQIRKQIAAIFDMNEASE